LSDLARCDDIQNMKVENLKHPFTLQEIVEIFGDYKNFLKIIFGEYFFQKIRTSDKQFHFQNTFHKMTKIRPKKKSFVEMG
jgi:hypothetical protein